MITTTLAGCFGTTDNVGTDEGDEVVLENTDEWPTYYVATANDLPTCPDAANSGKLYYIEDVAEFKACTSTGWVAVQIGGSGANSSTNQPPVIGYKILEIGDEEVNGTPVMLVSIGWSIIDVDGTVQSMGLDNNSDGVIDAPFTTQDGFGYVEITPELFWERHTEVWDYDDDGELDTMCWLNLFWALNIIAVDDDGASTIERYYEHVDMFDLDSVENIEEGIIPQEHHDWMTNGSGTSACYSPDGGGYYAITAADNASDATSGDDSLIVLQFSQAPEDIEWIDLEVYLIDEEDMTSVTCSVDVPDGGGCELVQFGSDSTAWEMFELIHITENGNELCTTGPCEFSVLVFRTLPPPGGTDAIVVNGGNLTIVY